MLIFNIEVDTVKQYIVHMVHMELRTYGMLIHGNTETSGSSFEGISVTLIE